MISSNKIYKSFFFLSLSLPLQATSRISNKEIITNKPNPYTNGSLATRLSYDINRYILAYLFTKNSSGICIYMQMILLGKPGQKGIGSFSIVLSKDEVLSSNALNRLERVKKLNILPYTLDVYEGFNLPPHFELQRTAPKIYLTCLMGTDLFRLL